MSSFVTQAALLRSTVCVCKSSDSAGVKESAKARSRLEVRIQAFTQKAQYSATISQADLLDNDGLREEVGKYLELVHNTCLNKVVVDGLPPMREVFARFALLLWGAPLDHDGVYTRRTQLGLAREVQGIGDETIQTYVSPHLNHLPNHHYYSM